VREGGRVVGRDRELVRPHGVWQVAVVAPIGRHLRRLLGVARPQQHSMTSRRGNRESGAPGAGAYDGDAHRGFIESDGVGRSVCITRRQTSARR
jgi:hypothetical protein